MIILPLQNYCLIIISRCFFKQLFNLNLIAVGVSIGDFAPLAV